MLYARWTIKNSSLVLQTKAAPEPVWSYLLKGPIPITT